jgi:hypothetical protein
MSRIALTVVVCSVVLQGQGASLGALETRARSLGRELRVDSRDDVPIYERALAAGGANELDAVLRQLTTAVLAEDPNRSVTSLQERLRLVYDPWQSAGEYTGRAPEVREVTVSGVPTRIVTWLTRLGGAGSPRSHAQILAYVRHAQQWILQARTGNMFDDHGMFVQPVRSSRAGEAWFLAHGVRWGSGRVDINVALISFNGTLFQTRWSREKVAKGVVISRQDGITLEYVVYPTRGGPNFVEYIETLEFTEDGLRTVSRRMK